MSDTTKEEEEEVVVVGAAKGADGGDSPENGNPRGGDNPKGENEDSGQEGDDDPSWKNDPDYADYISSKHEAETPSGDVKQISLEEYNFLVEAASNWNTLQSNEVAMAVIGHINGGGKIEDLVSHFDTRDYFKMTPIDLFKMDISSIPDITEDEISEAIEDFESKPSHEQKKIAAQLRGQLSSKKNTNGSGLVSAYQKNMQKHKEIVDKFNQDFDSELNRWKKKGSFFDVPVTDGVVQEIRQFVAETGGQIFLDKNGFIDAKKFFQAVFTSKYLPEIAQAKQRKGAKKSAEDYVREHQNAGSNPSKPGGETPSNVDKRGFDVVSEFKKAFPTKK